MHAESPFIHRLQKWPRGYPGDFETIEYLCDGQVKARPLTTAWFLEHQALRTVAAQQHRNKVVWQASKIVDVVYRKDKARILSIGCGGSRDLRQIQHNIANRDLLIVLNDMDVDALDLSRATLKLLEPMVTTIVGDIFHAIRHLSRHMPYDLVVAGGIFDYIEDRQLIWLLPKLMKLLSPDGILCFTNIARGNPDRVWMEYLSDWFIKERSENDILSLLEDSGVVPQAQANFTRDVTGLTVLTTVVGELGVGAHTHE